MTNKCLLNGTAIIKITVKDREDAKLRCESQSAHSSSMIDTGRDLVGDGRVTATPMASPKW